jgi:hypothetical protein
MNCPPEIAEIVLEIIATGLLEARAAAWSGDSQRCAAEADHLHNLPGLLRAFSWEKMRYYWDAERTSYLSQLGDRPCTSFETLWTSLGKHLERASSSSKV